MMTSFCYSGEHIKCNIIIAKTVNAIIIVIVFVFGGVVFSVSLLTRLTKKNWIPSPVQNSGVSSAFISVNLLCSMFELLFWAVLRVEGSDWATVGSTRSRTAAPTPASTAAPFMPHHPAAAHTHGGAYPKHRWWSGVSGLASHPSPFNFLPPPRSALICTLAFGCRRLSQWKTIGCEIGNNHVERDWDGSSLSLQPRVVSGAVHPTDEVHHGLQHSTHNALVYWCAKRRRPPSLLWPAPFVNCVFFIF